jgi:DNA/RNA-binding domain of Phe-tRNA-synthetase-like protein
MTVRFVIHSSIFETFPGLVVVGTVAHGIGNRTANVQVNNLWEESWRAGAQHAAAYSNAQSHPRVVPWREQMRAADAHPKKFPSSIEALLRRAGKGGEPFAVNPLVDAYNSVSLRHVVPAGGFDLDELNTDLELRRSREDDHFTALGENTPVTVPMGEISYAVGSTILTRHFVWRQSGQAAITPETRSVVLISEILGPVLAESPELANTVLNELQTMLSTCFDVPARPFLLDSTRSETILAGDND